MEFKIRMVLIDKDLWEVVDETEKEPAADAPDTRAWQKKDEKHCNYLPLGQGLGARTCTLMQEIGRSLEEVYRTKALARRRTDARPYQQGYDPGEQLEAIGVTVSDDGIAMILLCSLPESYENSIIVLESCTDNLSAEFVRTRLLQEEARRIENNSTKQEESAYIAKSTKRKRERTVERWQSHEKKLKCFYCGWMGHVAAECHRRHAQKKSQAKRHRRRGRRQVARRL
jgi:hypothetical protein